MSERWTPPAIRDDEPLRGMASPDTWDRAMRIIAGRHRIPAGDLAPFPTGSAVVYGGGEHVIKLAHPRWLAEIRHEAAVLRRLQGRLPFETPEFVAEGELEGWSYVVMGRLGGEPLSTIWPGLDAGGRIRMAALLGERARELHTGIDPAGGEDWPAFLAERRDTAVAHHRRGGAPESWVNRIEPFLARTERSPRDPVFLHTELLDEHVFVRPSGRDWEITGFIDFLDSRVGHPDYEFAAMIEFLFRGEPGCLRSCVEAYGWTTEEMGGEGEQRLAAWGLLHRFGSLRRVLEAAGDPEPAGFAELTSRVYGLSPAPTV